jgi:hypothetical protein
MEMERTYALLSQLILYAAEDIGLVDPTLLTYERECSDEFKNLMKKKSVKMCDVLKSPELCEIVDRGVIAAAISGKSRDLPMFSFTILFDIYQNENFKKSLPEYVNRFVAAVGNDDEKQALYYAYIIGLFYNKMDRLLSMIEGHSEKRNTDLVHAWVDEYKRSKRLIILAGSIALLCRDLDFSCGEYKDGLEKHLSSPVTKVNIPDYAYDRHTFEGKKKGRGWDHFFKEGALLVNERFPNRWEKPGQAAYYAAEKKGLDSEEKIIEAIKKKYQTSKNPEELMKI